MQVPDQLVTCGVKAKARRLKGFISRAVMSRDDFATAMLAWLNARIASAETIVEADTPLFSPGLVESLGVLELVAYVERATETVIPNSRIRLDNFSTVNHIADVFLRTQA